MAPIPTYEAGRAFVQVNPSLRGLHQKIAAEVAKVRGVTVPVTAEADTSRIRPALQAAVANDGSPYVRSLAAAALTQLSR